MAVASSGLTPRQLVILAVLEGITQGVLVPLLIDFLASKRSHHLWFKVYVIFVNVLSLTHTTLRVAEAFLALGPIPHLFPFELSSIIVASGVTAFTQAFFIYRCWRIFNRRTILIIPYLVGLTTTLVCGALIGLFSAGVIPNTLNEIKIAVTIWTFTAFALDLCMTLTTIIYLYRLRADYNNHDNVFLTAWHVIWASAAPPLVLMALLIFDVYILPETLLPSPLAAALTEKFLLLSLMIALMGQGYVQRQLERPRHVMPTGLMTSQGTLGLVSEPVFASRSDTYELQARSVLGTTRSGYDSDATRKESYIGDINRSRFSVAKPATESSRSVQIHLP
ncbi:unnamed protein product [Rhizoctonia solani]|uniref:Transmembrane protein n=3 Tax=Rhizoctonia solani TaxID=456999 RepID=A0A8H2WZN4_9AGAM|nr:transmembrane protein, putative [Rhizoctonia solani AG-3 Rhs1AP]KEP48760.1 putative transmembrane protein [Rhizoctonia solani 123E]CAE6408211.1 unnamed protein product [Rhizoctonia solani]CAE6506909.1 unnamed protein product [Rhizoctonia solani]